MNKLLPFLPVLIVCACKPEPTIAVTVVGELSARKSYAGLYDEMLTDARYDSIKNNNPEMQDKRLEKAGLIKDGKLLAEKFKVGAFSLNNKGNVVAVKYGDVFKDGWRKIYLSRGLAKNTISVSKGGIAPLMCYTADIIPGGYPEIITLNEWYIMNGDNFDVTIYEVKTTD